MVHEPWQKSIHCTLTDIAALLRSAVFHTNAKKLVHHRSLGTPPIVPRSLEALRNRARICDSVSAVGIVSGACGLVNVGHVCTIPRLASHVQSDEMRPAISLAVTTALPCCINALIQMTRA